LVVIINENKTSKEGAVWVYGRISKRAWNVFYYVNLVMSNIYFLLVRFVELWAF
jgi:hypothetical protein